MLKGYEELEVGDEYVIVYGQACKVRLVAGSIEKGSLYRVGDAIAFRPKGKFSLWFELPGVAPYPGSFGHEHHIYRKGPNQVHCECGNQITRTGTCLYEESKCTCGNVFPPLMTEKEYWESHNG